MIVEHSNLQLENDTLIDLGQAMPQYLTHSRADNTIKTYKVGYDKWKNWAEHYHVKPLPANPVTFALFILSLIQTGHTKSTIEMCFYSVKYFHVAVFMEDPTAHPLAEEMLEVAKRLCKKPTNRKVPLTLEELTKIHALLETHPPSLKNMRTSLMFILAFAGFLRFDELSRIRCGDIQFSETYVKIFLESSKTDVYRDGRWVHIAGNSSSPTCPLLNLKRYLHKAGLNTEKEHHRDKYIFRALSSTKKSEKLRDTNKPLSYTRVREIVLAACKSIGLNHKLYGTHSLRSGGASCAANVGVPDRLFKRHGRWTSDKAKDMYVKDNLDRLLTVTKSMCL